MYFKNYVLFFTICFLLIQPVLSFAWGHLDFMGNDWAESSLTYTVIHKNRIHYCVQVENEKAFPKKQVSKQVFSALTVWLSGVEDFKKIPIKEVDCNQKADFVIQIEKKTEYPELSGFEVPRYENGHYYSAVKLNSDYVYKEKKSQYKVSNFASLLPIPFLEDRVIHDISFSKPINVTDFSTKYKIDYQTVYLSTYKMLLHETGHAFGLCDTEESLFQFCDSKFKTADRPAAIMNNADFFYLTPDDTAGIRSLFKRLQTH